MMSKGDVTNMKKWIFIFLSCLLLGGCKMTTAAVPLVESKPAFSVIEAAPKVIDNALKYDNYQFTLKVESNGNTQIWNGTQQLDDWQMKTTVDGTELSLNFTDGNITGMLGDQKLTLLPAMFGLFSPKQHLQLLSNEKSQFKKLSEEYNDGSLQYVTVTGLSNKTVNENIVHLLGKQFQLSNEVQQLTEQIGLNYVLWFDSNYYLQKMSIVIYNKKDYKNANEQRLTFEIEDMK